MPFTLQNFAAKRPYLFHLTARENMDELKRRRALLPASHIFEEAGQSTWLREKRPQHVEMTAQGRKIKVRDQSPLHNGNMKLSDSWSFADFIAHLNGRVFFWPGRINGLPIDYGTRHYERYVEEMPRILRISTEQLFGANEALAPEFCRFNSGSPRWTYGKPSPRGKETFVTCDRADFGISNVVEVTFPGQVTLPSVEVGNAPGGPWTAL